CDPVFVIVFKLISSPDSSTGCTEQCNVVIPSRLFYFRKIFKKSCGQRRLSMYATLDCTTIINRSYNTKCTICIGVKAVVSKLITNEQCYQKTGSYSQ